MFIADVNLPPKTEATNKKMFIADVNHKQKSTNEKTLKRSTSFNLIIKLFLKQNNPNYQFSIRKNNKRKFLSYEYIFLGN